MKHERISPQNKNTAKNICLVFLTALSIYQISQLWLVESISHNFFYANLNHIVEPHNDYFKRPTRILTNLGELGGNRFNVLYETLDSNILDILNNIFDEVLSNGELVSMHDTIEKNNLLQNSNIIWEYSFNVPARILSVPIGLDYFDSVVFVPSTAASNLVYMFFVDNARDKAAQFNLVSLRNRDILNALIQASYREIADFHYASSLIMGFDFDKNIFLPMWRGNTFSFYDVIMQNSFVDQPNIRANITSFFENPNAVWGSRRYGVYIFGDANQVVRYFDNDTLEFVSHRQGLSPLGLEADFDIAVSFINRDPLVVNDFYLTRFEEDYNKRVFYFDYIVENFPIILSESFKAKTGLNHALEVTVENGIVTRYRKIAHNFIVSDNVSEIRENAITLVNNMEDITPNDIRFGYVVTPAGVNLEWKVE